MSIYIDRYNSELDIKIGRLKTRSKSRLLVRESRSKGIRDT